MRASARANKSFGYKAVIVHTLNGGRERTEVLAGRYAFNRHTGKMDLVRAGHNFETREEAIAFARRTIEVRERENAINAFRLKRKSDGTRPTREEAIAALGLEKELSDG